MEGREGKGRGYSGLIEFIVLCLGEDVRFRDIVGIITGAEGETRTFGGGHIYTWLLPMVLLTKNGVL